MSILIALMAASIDAFLSVTCDDCLTAMNRYLCVSCWRTCGVVADDVPRAVAHLRSHLFGQDASIDAIAAALRRHASHPVRPLVMHFAGDNGVGKTLASKLIAHARLATFRTAPVPTDIEPEESDEPIDGYLYMRGESFREADTERIRALRSDIRRRIANFLFTCPDGLVVLDEVEKIHRATMSVLLDFIDGTMPFVDVNGTRVSTSRAIFVFISDFGAAASTANMSDVEVRALVESTSLDVWETRKQVDLVTDIVPFRALDFAALRTIALARLEALRRRLRRLKVVDVAWPPTLADALANQVRLDAGVLRMSGRGLDRAVAHYVVDPLLDALDSAHERRAGAVYDNITITFVAVSRLATLPIVARVTFDDRSRASSSRSEL